jgi:centromere protein J
MLKLKRERLLWETHHNAARDLPDRHERREIEELRSEIASLQEEMLTQEKRAKLNARRLQDKNAALQQDNDDLAAEVPPPPPLSRPSILTAPKAILLCGRWV